MNFVRVTLPKEATVLLLEDSPMRIEWFKARIPGLYHVRTFQQFKDFFKNGMTADFLFLDHDLGPVDEVGDGRMAAAFLRESFGSGGRYTVIHSWNLGGALKMKDSLPEAIYLPFGQFELEAE